VLENLSERVRLCYERAAEAREHAEAMSDPEAKDDFARMEKCWLLLARGYEFSERLDRFIRNMPKFPHAFDPHTMLQASSAAIFAKDKESRMVVANPGCLNLLGKSLSEVCGRNDVQWHSDRTQAKKVLSNDQCVIESGQTEVYEEVFDTPLGTRIILSTKAPLLNDEGQIVGIVGVANDITERKRREERTEFLRSELAHRMKNSISLVQAMARQSIEPGDGLSRFEGRLSAYARSQDLLQRQQGVPLHVLLYAHLHALPAADQLCVDGPDIVLPPNITMQIGIALHELLTNSIKYGALGGEGRVDVHWHLETINDRTYLVLSWLEQHSQLQPHSYRQGFGYQVLSRAVAYNLNGLASYDKGPGRVSWTLRAELLR
jgi:PAS domain S-box-containing protein